MSERLARFAAVGASSLLATSLVAGCAGASSDQGLATPAVTPTSGSQPNLASPGLTWPSPAPPPTTAPRQATPAASPSPWSRLRREWQVLAHNFAEDSLERYIESLWELEGDLDQGTATEADVARMGNYLVEQADDLQALVETTRVNEEVSARVKKLSAAAGRAREAGTAVQDACNGEALASTSSEACQGGYDRLLASYRELSAALRGLGA